MDLEMNVKLLDLAEVGTGDLIFFRRTAPAGSCFEAAVVRSESSACGLFHCGLIVRDLEPAATAVLKNGFAASSDAATESPASYTIATDSRPIYATDNFCVAHADLTGVKVETFSDFIQGVQPDEFEVYRVRVDEAKKEQAAIFAVAKAGVAYNDVFDWNCVNSKGEEAYYCSQLLAHAYKDAEVNFVPHEMSFSDKHDEILPYWREYFEERHRPVPLKELGYHPGRLAETPGLEKTLSCRMSGRLSIKTRGRHELLHWINGAAVALSGGPTFKVIQPRNGKFMASCSSATAEQVQQVVKMASVAQKGWAQQSWLQRGEVLQKTAHLIREHLEDVALIECEDNGKPIWEARADVASCADTFQFYGGAVSSLAGQHFPLDASRFAYTRREPLGVIGCVGAWNYPFQTCSWKTAPALVCGNSVVYKPSPLAPVSAGVLGELLKAAGLPDGVFNVVQGEKDTGTALVLCNQVNKISFTGSVESGKLIMQACATRSIKPVTLELGGKSSLIILKDADIDSAVAGALMANFYSQGQVCSNASKVLVHRSILSEFTEKVVNSTKALKVGDPLNEDTRVGSAISMQHLEKVKAYIYGAMEAGAKREYGGEVVEVPGLEGGFYLSPCILTAVTQDMRVYREEIFGSVMLIIPFDEDDEAVQLANDTRMGLAAGLFTKSLSKAHQLAARLHSGNVYINTYNDVSPFIPYGGFGESGFGRENGIAALEHYTQYKSVFVNMAEKLTNPFEDETI